MREAVGADFVSVLVDPRDALGNSSTCGHAYVMGPEFINQEFAPAALSIVSVQCATAKWSLAHNNTAAVCAGFRAERTFVEFGWSGVSTGLLVAPFTSLASGLAGSRTQGTLVINNADTGFTGVLSAPRTYVHDGTDSVTLGGP